MVCTLRDNTTATDTSVVVTIAANAAAGVYSDTTHSAAVAQFDKLVWKCVNASASASAGVLEMKFMVRAQ